MPMPYGTYTFRTKFKYKVVRYTKFLTLFRKNLLLYLNTKQPTVSVLDKPGQLVARHAPNCPNSATEQTGSEFPVLLFKSTALRAYGYLSLTEL